MTASYVSVGWKDKLEWVRPDAMHVPETHKMPSLVPRGQAFNQTRQRFLATHLAVAHTHWSRLRGLIGASEDDFRNGCGLWIRPCRGVHTLAMRYPIDVLYLDPVNTVIHLVPDLQPWRFAPIRLQAASVLELPNQTIAQTETLLGDRIEIKIQEDVKL